MEQQRWWWCLKHNAVEPDMGCANTLRLGPFPTQDEAARALDTVHERNERYDAEDEAWEGGSGSVEQVRDERYDAGDEAAGPR